MHLSAVISNRWPLFATKSIFINISKICFRHPDRQSRFSWVIRVAYFLSIKLSCTSSILALQFNWIAVAHQVTQTHIPEFWLHCPALVLSWSASDSHIARSIRFKLDYIVLLVITKPLSANANNTTTAVILITLPQPRVLADAEYLYRIY